jgi:spore coat polysaccharide biosynthesis protein SpsF
MKTVAIIQARMTSTRLPGKVLLDVAGKPMLTRVIERARRARTLDLVGVATSTDASDDRLEAFCREAGVPCHRGSLEDVLDRYHGAARQWQADVIVRITSDCPLIDPGVVDLAAGAFLGRAEDLDYCSNVLPTRTYPRGLDTEVFPFRLLDHLWRADQDPRSREHVTQYVFWKPELFRTHCVQNGSDESRHRWTVDTPEDLELVRRVYGHFGDRPFGWTEVLRLLEDHPDWVALNSHVVQKAV